MRQRIRDHLVIPPAAGQPEDGSEILGKFDLKHDTGAIVDIEFMVQYVGLAGASRHGGLETDFEHLQRYRQEVHRIWLARMEAGDH